MAVDGGVCGDAAIFEACGEELFNAALNVGSADDGFAACCFGVSEAGGIEKGGESLAAVAGVNDEAGERGDGELNGRVDAGVTLRVGEIADARVNAEARGGDKDASVFDGPDDAVGVVGVEPDTGARGEVGEFTFGLPGDDAQFADLFEKVGAGNEEGLVRRVCVHQVWITG